jgi:hypothetical protein
MANTILGKVWLLDTAAVLVQNQPVIITGFLFKPNTTDDQVVVKDDSGIVYLDLKANHTTAELQIPFLFGTPQTFMGFNLATLTASAKLYVYLSSTAI